MPAKISIFVTSYNQKEYLKEAIESILSQTVLPYEIIVVDDASSDGSQELIESYKHRYPQLIRAFYNESNQGIPKTKNFALDQVRGDLVTYLDGDDRVLPRKLEVCLAILERNRWAKICFSNFYFIDDNGRRKGIWAEEGKELPSRWIFREVFGMQSPIWSLRNELVDYKLMKEVGFNDVNLAMYHDWDLRVRLTQRGMVAYCAEPLGEYRVHGGGISKAPAVRHIDEVRRVFRKNGYLLKGIRFRDRVKIRTGISSNIGRFAGHAMRQELEKGNRKNAFGWWCLWTWYNPRSCELRIPAEIILPTWGYRKIKAFYHGLGKLYR